MIRIWSVILLCILLFTFLSSCTNVLVVKPAEFVVNRVDITPNKVIAGDNVTVTAEIGNIGGEIDTYTAVLNVDGNEKDRQIITIKPSENKTCVFSLNESNSGSHTVEIGLFKQNFTVIEKTYLLQHDKANFDSWWFRDDPWGQWIRFDPPVAPFQIKKIFVMGRRTDFNQPDTKYYTIKIWDGDFKKELFSADYPYSKFKTVFDKVENEINPPVIVKGKFTIEFISHSDVTSWSAGQNPTGKVILIVADYTSDSPGNIGISAIGSNNIPAFEMMFQYGPKLKYGSWIIRVEGTGNKDDAVIASQEENKSQYRVFFDRGGGLQSLNIDGTGYIDNSYKSDRSPDGKTIVYMAQTDFNYRALYLANADGTYKRPIIPIGGGIPDHAFPAWSPDGSKIAFCKSQTATGVFGFLCYNIWVMNPDGTDIRKISDTPPTSLPRSHACPQWFPDSKKIAYATNESGYWEIYTTPIDYYESVLIVKLQQKFKPGWFPWDYKITQDGKRLIYRDGPGTDLKTLVIDISSKKITEWPNIDTSEISPVVSQDGSVTVITKPDGLYYSDNSHKEPIKIPNTSAGDIAIEVK